MRGCPSYLLAVGLSLMSMAVCAQQAAPSYKLTTGMYALTGAGSVSHGLDMNLRRSAEDGNLWLAWYRSPEQNVSQPRAGWDTAYQVASLRVMPSVQAASSGFWGGSLSLEAGETWFAGVGLGRTNLRPYTNLNFGIVPNNTLVADQSQQGPPGTTLSYPHTFTPGTVGSVTFSSAASARPATAPRATAPVGLTQ